jgi:hypothetical protein
VSLLLAATSEEAAELSRRAQERLVKLGRVQEPRADLADGNQAGDGDLIRAGLNSSIQAGGRLITNRDTLRVEQIGGDQAKVRRRELDGSWTGEFMLPAGYMARRKSPGAARSNSVSSNLACDPGAAGSQAPLMEWLAVSQLWLRIRDALDSVPTAHSLAAPGTVAAANSGL